MKIILTTSMSGLGGTENATFRLAKLLHEHGHTVILASSDGPLVKDALALGIAWHNIDLYRSKAAYLKGTLAYMRLLRREKPDIIHCQMARIVPAVAVAAKTASPKTKVFYHARGLDPETYPKIAKLFDKLGVYIIANCKHEQQKLIRHGFPANRISYTYNALPRLSDGLPEKPERGFVMLGTLSRLDKVRAVTQTIDIFKILLDRGLNVRLQIAGIGEELDNLKAQAERLGVADKITFLGGVRDLATYFRETDILVNTIDCEGDHGAGIGNNILEAGLYRTPVVSYDAAGISEMVVNGETGFCIPLRDYQAFADAVEQMVRDPGLRRRTADALKQHVEHSCSDEEIYRTTMAAYAM